MLHQNYRCDCLQVPVTLSPSMPLVCQALGCTIVVWCHWKPITAVHRIHQALPSPNTTYSSDITITWHTIIAAWASGPLLELPAQPLLKHQFLVDHNLVSALGLSALQPIQPVWNLLVVTVQLQCLPLVVFGLTQWSWLLVDRFSSFELIVICLFICLLFLPAIVVWLFTIGSFFSHDWV